MLTVRRTLTLENLAVVTGHCLPYALAGLAIGLWLPYTLLGLIGMPNDTSGYLALADALLRLSPVSTDRPDRFPGYSLFLLACRALAWPFQTDPLRTTIAVQVALLGGIATLAVYDLGRRISGRRVVGYASAALFAADGDVHMTAGWVLTESLATVLAVSALWLRVRDDSWRRGRWVLAALALTKPYLAPLAVVFGGVEVLRVRRIRAAAVVVWPVALLVVGWLVIVRLGGGDAIDAMRRIGALTDFGTVYQSGLWKKATLAPREAEVLESAATRRLNAYRAAAQLTDSPKPWDPPTNWAPLRQVANAAIAADPIGYLRARVGIVPMAFTTEPPLPFLPPESPSYSIRNWYVSVFYGSGWFFAGLLLVAVWNGLAWPMARPWMRALLIPYVVTVFASTAALSLGTYEVGRLVLVYRPVAAIVWGCVLAHVVDGIPLEPVAPRST
jgi:hypothetical protein